MEPLISIIFVMVISFIGYKLNKGALNKDEIQLLEKLNINRKIAKKFKGMFQRISEIIFGMKDYGSDLEQLIGYTKTGKLKNADGIQIGKRNDKIVHDLSKYQYFNRLNEVVCYSANKYDSSKYRFSVYYIPSKNISDAFEINSTFAIKSDTNKFLNTIRSYELKVYGCCYDMIDIYGNLNDNDRNKLVQTLNELFHASGKNKKDIIILHEAKPLTNISIDI